MRNVPSGFLRVSSLMVAAVGGLMILIAATADWLGIGGEPGFGLGQGDLAFAGFLILLAAWAPHTKIGKELSQRVSLLYDSKRFLWGIICLGIVLRLAQYLFNRSLWLDESLLALNIINRSFSELLQPLDYNQGAPIGFLIVEKLLVQVFGDSEYVLRLFPFLCGIVSLFLFFKVTTDYIGIKAVPVALGLFAISDRLIYYSSEVKQYSSDLVIALLIYVMMVYIQSKRLTVSRIALFGVVGAIAIWFSHPVVFVLAGVGAGLTLFCVGRKEWRKTGRFSVAYSLWALSFGASYFVSLRNLSNNESLLNFWADAFMPFPPSSFSDFGWFVSTFLNIIAELGLSLSKLKEVSLSELKDLSFVSIAALTFLVGCVSMSFEKKEGSFVLISPALFALLVSGFHKYPFHARFLLFTVPSLLILIAEGAEQIRDKTVHVLGTALIGLLVAHPLLSAGYHLIKPRTFEEIKPVLGHIREHWQDGDVLYLYHASQYAFKYYSGSYGFRDDDYIVGISSKSNWQNYVSDLDKLRGNRRVWILFSHVFYRKGSGEEKFFLQHLDSIGIRLDSFKSAGAAVYLYDLSPFSTRRPLQLSQSTPGSLRRSKVGRSNL
jgi:hypothetical protein